MLAVFPRSLQQWDWRKILLQSGRWPPKEFNAVICRYTPGAHISLWLKVNLQHSVGALEFTIISINADLAQTCAGMWQ